MMYHEEKIIDGTVFVRDTPISLWRRRTVLDLTNQIGEMKTELASLRELAEIGRAAVRVRVVLDAGPWSDAAQTVESDLDNAVSTYLAAHPEEEI